MSERAQDGLLVVTRLLLRIGEWLFLILAAIVGAAGIIGAVAVLLGAPEAAGGFAEKLPDLAPALLAGMLLAVLALVSGLLVIAWQFTKRLRQIVDTVPSDPFIRVNAVRLRQMGWLMVGTYPIVIALTATLSWFAYHFPDEHIHSEIGLDMGGIVTILLLFILARVFDHGAEMREDLEGTV